MLTFLYKYWQIKSILHYYCSTNYTNSILLFQAKTLTHHPIKKMSIKIYFVAWCFLHLHCNQSFVLELLLTLVWTGHTIPKILKVLTVLLYEYDKFSFLIYQNQNSFSTNLLTGIQFAILPCLLNVHSHVGKYKYI